MQKAIIGKKIGMTQIFDENGKVIPVTVVEAGPCTIVQKKTVENDGYAAVQMGYGDVKFMAAVGILLGLKKTLLAAFIGIVIGSLSAIIIRIKEKKEWKSEIPFGPYLCLGTYISMLFGDKLISLYISLI